MDGIKYIWNGTMWYEDEKYLELPVKMTLKLESLFHLPEKIIQAPAKVGMAAAKIARTPSKRKKATAVKAN